MGYVYLLLQVESNGTETFKIGVTKKDINTRISSLQTGNPNKISLLKFYESDNYKKIERLLHKKYFSNRTETNNEWFILTNEDVISFIDDCKKQDEMIIFMKTNNYFFD